MTIWIDSREKPRAVQKILAEFDREGARYITNKLPVGDYMSMENPHLVIDRKQNLLEICSNVCQQHKRFKAEILLARELGIRLVFLCEHGRNIRTMDDVIGWTNPRLKTSPLAVSGERLYRIMQTLRANYGVEFYFCEKKDTGKRILELLEAPGLEN